MIESTGLTAERATATGPSPSTEPNLLDHPFGPILPALAQASSTRRLERLALFRRFKNELLRLLDYVLCDPIPTQPGTGQLPVRTVAWNIERGTRLEGVAEAFHRHPDLRLADLLLLTELDYGMARSGNRKVPIELGELLGMSYAFAPSYLNLEKGSGLESSVKGENAYGLHGNAVMARYPLLDPRSLALPNGRDKMRGKEKRLGNQRAVFTVVDHPAGRFRAVSVHLDAHSTQKHRMRQMRLVLDFLEHYHADLPVVIGGDWNTSTYNSRSAFFSILGYCRRVAMGVRNVIENHYPYPDRWFERHLFRLLEKRGYRYRDLNEPGGCTLHYHVADLAANGRMADWIPHWCFWFINWALARNNGRCSFKLDWFAGKGIKPYPDSRPRVLNDVNPPGYPLSDHDPILLDFVFSSADPGHGETK
jgi:endonuclease/exonuclease/phosphatase family metal-dependent hydrolase